MQLQHIHTRASLGKAIGRRVRFHHIFKPRKRPAVRVYRVEHIRIGGVA
jgi:hypothetical protein